MAGDSGAHAESVEKPRAKRGQGPGTKIVVKEGSGVRQIVALEELVQCVAAKVVDEASRKIDVGRVTGREGVTL